MEIKKPCLRLVIVALAVLLATVLAESPAGPIIYVTGNLWFNDTYPNLVSSLAPQRPKEPFMLNYNSTLEGWDIRNVTFVSLQVQSGAMVAGKSQIYTFGMDSLSGRGIDSYTYAAPTRIADFEPQEIVSLLSLDASTQVLLNNGSIFSWGSGDRMRYFGDVGTPVVYPLGQLPENNPPLNSYSMAPVDSSTAFKSMWVESSLLSFALDEEGNLWSWGSNRHRTTNTGTDHNIPQISINATFGSPIIQVVGNLHAMALLENGTFLCWGLTDGNSCGDNTFVVNDAVHAPFLVDNRPSPDVKWTKLAAGSRMSFALANDSTLWAWGRWDGSAARPIPGAPTSPYCNYSASSWKVCIVHQVVLPEGREQVKILDFFGGSEVLYILNALGEVYWTGLNIFDPPYNNVDRGWNLVPWTLPNGHAVDFSASQSGDNGAIFFLTKLVTSCIEPKPFMGDIPVRCIDGIWQVAGDIVLEGPLTISTPVLINGDLTISQPITITTKPIGSPDPLITVKGCVHNATLLEFEVQLLTFQLNHEPDPLFLLESSSACSTDLNLPIATSQPKNCKKSSASSETTSANDRLQVRAIFKIDVSTCRIWWIILISVLGGAVIISAIVWFVIHRSHSLKLCCRPYAPGRQ